MIPPETIEQIAGANDIVDVIGSYFPLKRAGSAFKALCPFHQEKSPSFTVNPQRQRFHCFGCGAGGSVFDFVAKYESIDFPTAVRRLAERAGIRIIEEERSPGEDRELNLRKRLLALHQQAAEWFHKLLMTAAEAKGARNYLRKRGLNGEVAQRWKIGYAPDAWEAFSSWAARQEFKREEIVQSGLVSLRDAENPQSDFYDRFRDRVMFPICNELGEVIAFSGRVLASDAQAAKYVNSPETPLFKKGDVLFGLHKSKRALIDKKSAIVLEGQIDLITAFEAGVQNVVAPQGTAFTEKQARTLKRYAEEVILCFDADEAGRKAAERSLPALLGFNLGIRVIELPPGEDPDSLIRSEGAETFFTRVNAARDFFDYQIDVQTAKPEFAAPQGKVKFAQALAPTIVLIKDLILREAVAGNVAQRLDMSLSQFWDLTIRPRKPVKAAASSWTETLTPTEPLDALTFLALGDPEVRRWIAAQPWSQRLLEIDGAALLVKILDSDVSLADATSLNAFSASLDQPARALLDPLLEFRSHSLVSTKLNEPDQALLETLLLRCLPANRIAAAQDWWRAIEKRDLLARRDLLVARMRDSNLSSGEVTEIQKQILDLQKHLTDISRPLSPPGLE